MSGLTPAPPSSNSGTVVLPRVPYDNRLDSRRRYYRDGSPAAQPLRAPESQRVVPAPPAAGANPARFFDKTAGHPASYECLRPLVVRTRQLYRMARYERCLGAD